MFHFLGYTSFGTVFAACDAVIRFHLQFSFAFRTRILILQSLVGIALDWIILILLYHFMAADIEVCILSTKIGAFAWSWSSSVYLYKLMVTFISDDLGSDGSLYSQHYYGSDVSIVVICSLPEFTCVTVDIYLSHYVTVWWRSIFIILWR